MKSEFETFYPDSNPESSEGYIRKIDDILERCRQIRAAILAIPDRAFSQLDQRNFRQEAGKIKQKALQFQKKVIPGIAPDRNIADAINQLLTKLTDLESKVASNL